MTEEQVAAAEGDYENSPHLTEKQKWVIRWAELVTKNEAKRDDASWEKMRTFFSPQEMIELTMIICHFNLMNRLNDTLQLDLETPPPGMNTLKVPPERLARYARNVLSRDLQNERLKGKAASITGRRRAMASTRISPQLRLSSYRRDGRESRAGKSISSEELLFQR